MGALIEASDDSAPVDVERRGEAPPPAPEGNVGAPAATSSKENGS